MKSSIWIGQYFFRATFLSFVLACGDDVEIIKIPEPSSSPEVKFNNPENYLPNSQVVPEESSENNSNEHNNPHTEISVCAHGNSRACETSIGAEGVQICLRGIWQTCSVQRSVVSLAVGDIHSCALLIGGRVKCWGSSAFDALGLPGEEDLGDDESLKEVPDVKLGGRVIYLAAGGSNTCVIMEDDALKCWGINIAGRLGQGNTKRVIEPSEIPPIDLGMKASKLAIGEFHICALGTNGRVRCWGDNQFGQLGYGHTNNIGDDETPAEAGEVSLGEEAIDVAVGFYKSCALLKNGGIKCWGLNVNGELGYLHTRSIGDDETPAQEPILNLRDKMKGIVGSESACAISSQKKIQCWGYLASPTLFANPWYEGWSEIGQPFVDINLEQPMLNIDISASHACAILSNGQLKCWGQSFYGELGYGNRFTIGDDEKITSISPLSFSQKVVSVAVGIQHNCALFEDGTVRCWGYNSSGQLGYGHTRSIGDDEDVSGLPALDLY